MFMLYIFYDRGMDDGKYSKRVVNGEKLASAIKCLVNAKGVSFKGG